MFRKCLAKATVPITAVSITGKHKNAKSNNFKAGVCFLQGFGVIIGLAAIFVNLTQGF